MNIERVSFTQKKENLFRRGKVVYTIKQVVEFIKQGHEVEIVDEDGIDQTDETLMKLALGKHLIKPSGEWLLMDLLLLLKRENLVLDGDLLVDIICSGDLENWLIRNRRAL